MQYRRVGQSGLKLPEISLGLWHGFGADNSLENAKALLKTAFDAGITHFDVANNYGPPPGAAETTLGKLLRSEFAGKRDELIISSKAGYPMWAGPYGSGGSRKHLLASLDQSLTRMGLDYVDIFYSHRFDPDTPLEETMSALDTMVRQGKALYVGISAYSEDQTHRACELLKELGTSCFIHQPRYSILDPAIETNGVLSAIEAQNIGCIVFSPLAQGMLTNKYLAGVPADSRAKEGRFLSERDLSIERVEHLKELAAIAENRGQSLAQMAISWVLRDPRITSALMGATRPCQVEDCVAALGASSFADAELAAIQKHAFSI